MKCDGTSAETRFRLSAKRTSPFKSAGASVQSTTGSRGVRISGSNAGYTMFRGSVKGTGYPLHSPVSPSLPLPCVTMCHHISNAVYLLRKLHSDRFLAGYFDSPCQCHSTNATYSYASYCYYYQQDKRKAGNLYAKQCCPGYPSVLKRKALALLFMSHGFNLYIYFFRNSKYRLSMLCYIIQLMHFVSL